jgi:hypothetical protein
LTDEVRQRDVRGAPSIARQWFLPGNARRSGSQAVSFRSHHVMKTAVLTLAALIPLAAHAAHWPLDAATDAGLTVRGKVALVEGVEGKAVSLAGGTVLGLKDSAALGHAAAGFSLSL